MGLVRLAMLSKQDDVRLAACKKLQARSAHAYMPTLMNALSTPVETKLETVRDADGIHIRQTVRREGATAIVENTLQTNITTLVPNRNLGLIVGAAFTEAQLGIQQTAKDTAKFNRRIAGWNEAIYWVLEQTTGETLPHDPQAWWTWWQNYNELSDIPRESLSTTYQQDVDVPYVPFVPQLAPATTVVHGCFAKGTPVWALTGPVAIEQIRPGDRVLAQNPASGELGFKPVLQTTVGHQPMLELGIEEGPITATLGHVFWVSGQGWRMAKHLQVGDRLHGVSGWSEIKTIKDVPAAETHNLVVADFGTFFVGDARLLVHDITMRQPTAARVPGQAEVAPR